MPALSNSYIEFLFNDDGTPKPRVQPVINYIPESDSFILKYSIPGYHQPRQYFRFSVIPEQFPNEYVACIFRIYSINNSFLYRHPHNRIPAFKKSIINEFFGIESTVTQPDPEDIAIALYNLNLAIKLGRENHSLFYFDSYLEAYKVLHPEIKRYTKNIVRKIQTEFNKIISGL